MLLAGFSSPIQLVPNPFNWSPKVFLTDISVSVAKIKKIKKNVHLFLNFAPGRTLLTQSTDPQPIQLVSIPFNWSPNSVSYRYLSIGRSNKKKSKNNIHLFLNFASCRTFFTKSTGPQPIQLVPKQCFFTDISVSVAQMKEIKKTMSFHF